MAGLRVRHCWLSLLAAGGIAVSLPTMADAAFPGRNGRIGYIGDFAGGQAVVAVRPGGHDTVLARSADIIHGFAYKPDGRRIVFSAPGAYMPPGIGGGLNLRWASGRGHIRRLTDTIGHRGDTLGDWSPDGRSVVFVRDYTSVFNPKQLWPPRSGPCTGARLCVRIWHRGRSRALAPGVSGPVWSVRGWIAFGDDDGWIWAIRLDGSGKRRLVFDGGVGASNDWSPDGRRLVFVGADGKLATIGADGRQLRHLHRYGQSPAFSPDGRRIVYTNGTKLYTTDLRGRRRHLVHTRYPKPTSPDWQPLPRRRHR